MRDFLIQNLRSPIRVRSGMSIMAILSAGGTVLRSRGFPRDGGTPRGAFAVGAGGTARRLLLSGLIFDILPMRTFARHAAPSSARPRLGGV